MTTTRKPPKPTDSSMSSAPEHAQDALGGNNVPRLPSEGDSSAGGSSEAFRDIFGKAELLGNPRPLGNVSQQLESAAVGSSGFGLGDYLNRSAVAALSSAMQGVAYPQLNTAIDIMGAASTTGAQGQTNRLLKLKLTLPLAEGTERLGVDLNLAVNEWAKMLPFFIENSIKGKEAALQRAALAYQPQPQLRPVDLELLEMQKNAAESILAGTRWMTAAEVAEESGRSRSNPHALANRWKKEGRVFAIKYQGVERYPRYAFDEHMEPVPVIAEVIHRFVADADGDEIDPWDIAAWFESVNTYLDSARPRECLDRPDSIIFALEHMNNWTHG